MKSQKQPHTVEDGVEVSPTSSGKVDDNYDIYKQYQGIEYTEEEAKRVLWKIDCRVVPILFLIYLIQYLDKNSLNFASVYGLKTATKLEGQDYSWLGWYLYRVGCWTVLMFVGSIFYIGYLVAQWPAGYALQRLPIGKFLSITTFSKTPYSKG